MDKKDFGKLNMILKEFWTGELIKEVIVGNHSFSLKMLNHEEEVWRDKFLTLKPSMSFVTEKKAPTLAVAIVAVDGEDVENLVSVEDMNEGGGDVLEVLKMLMGEEWGKVSDEKKRRFYVAYKMLEFVRELPNVVVDKLFEEYMKFYNEKVKGIESFFQK